MKFFFEEKWLILLLCFEGFVNVKCLITQIGLWRSVRHAVKGKLNFSFRAI